MSLGSIGEHTLRISIPYLLAASGGVLAERSGIISLSLEGYMLSGAFSAVLGSSLSGSAWVGVVTGLLGGLLFGAMHALVSIRFRANQIIAGIGINLLAIGATRLFLKLIFRSSSNSGSVMGFGDRTFQNPLLWVGLAAMPVVAFVVTQTPFGLRLRAAGEHPKALASLGVDVARIRWAAVLASGALAGLGGSYLALDINQFSDEMTAGRGFIALAAIITGAWRPLRAGVACLFFAAAKKLTDDLQSLQVLPSQLASTIPYVVTIIALCGWAGRVQVPAALGDSEA